MKQLRDLLKADDLDGFLVPHSDEYQNEYLPPCNERLAWLTGFSGSAGMAVIMRNRAALFVDGRYTLQARKEADLKLFEILQIPQNNLADWIAARATTKTRIAFDPRLHTIRAIEKLRQSLATCAPLCQLVAVEQNPIDSLWTRRPAMPETPVALLALKYAGRKAETKIETLQKRLKKEKVNALVLTDLASIAWLFNIRGRDVPHTPLTLSHAIIHADKRPELIIDLQKIGTRARKRLSEYLVLRPANRLEKRLSSLANGARKIAVDPQKTPCWFSDCLKQAGKAVPGFEIVHLEDPCTLAKAVKNSTQIRGMRAAHLRDGVAVCRFLCWLEGQRPGTISEMDAAQRLENFREDSGKLIDISFETISAAGANGAIVHYRVDEHSNAMLKNRSLYLVDSGGQYLDGTTDITRTIAIGQPSRDMRRHFTLVLKGHIAIAGSRFPAGTRGVDLDALARMALWKAGLDYDHGTGHGVGAFLGVHEGPQAISRLAMQEFLPGMIVSNEPGYYRTGKYGIRIENLLLVVAEKVPGGGERPMLGFETLTLAPLDLSLVEPELLDKDEIAWLNDYHENVRRLISPHLETDKERQWLKRATRLLPA